MESNKLGVRKWFSFIVAGLMGQLAWAIENMYLSAYAFHCTQDYNIFIPAMTAASAVTATITTLFMGALSDRLGKRKAFISFGYILWGISIVAFAFLDPTSNITIASGANAVYLSGTLIVIMDCVMTFFGSTANDAAFNAYVTDNTNTNIRGRVESVLSVLPMMAMILITVLQALFVNKEGKGWDIFFYVFGGLTSVIGVALIFLIPKDTSVPNKEEPYFKNIFYGFRPSVIKANPLLYIVLIAFGVFNIAIQIFFTYLIVYIQNVLEMIDEFPIVLGSVLIVASILTVVFGLFMDKIGKNKIIIPSLAVAAIGAFLFFFVEIKQIVFAIVAGIILMSGYMITTAVMGAKIRDYTPKDEIGLFQGIRMIFAVMIPMVTGPYIGEALFYINKKTMVNEFGKTVVQPNQYMFLGAMVMLILAIIPVIILIRKERAIQKNEGESTE